MATPKQRKYAEQLMENDGNKRQAALSAGYSEGVAKNVKTHIEGSKGFQELLETKFKDSTLLNEHKRLLKQQYYKKSYFDLDLDKNDIKLILKRLNGKIVKILKKDLETDKEKPPDIRWVVYATYESTGVKERALDMAYKLKGRYSADKLELTNPYRELSDEELDQIINQETKRHKERTKK